MMDHKKTKAAGGEAKAAFRNTTNFLNYKQFNEKSQRGFSRDELPSPFFYYKKIFPNLRPASEWVNVCCCFHNDSKPSLSLNLKSGRFICHACGVKGGDVIEFHRKHNGLGFKEALLQLRKIRQGELK